MKIFVVVAAIIVAVAAGIWRLTRKFFAILNPPLRVHLVPDPSNGGFMKKALEQHGPELEVRGFEPIGAFRVSEIPGLVMTAYAQPFQNVCAVVYHHPLVGGFVDLFSENEREQGLTVSNAPAGEELDQPPGHEKVIDKTMTIPDMYDYLLNHRPSGPHKRIDAGNFVGEFQAAYAKEMDWRIKRGGVTEEEVRRSADVIGVTSGKAIQRTAQKLQQQYAQRKRTLPCQLDDRGRCPYETDGKSERDIGGMPFAKEDPRSCPKYGHVCPAFMEEFGLTAEDLLIRASIHGGSLIEDLVKRGVLEKDSPAYTEQKRRSDNMKRLYPPYKYPQYY